MGNKRIEGVVIDKQIIAQGTGMYFNPLLLLVIESKNGSRTEIATPRYDTESKSMNNRPLEQEELWVLIKGDEVVITEQDCGLYDIVVTKAGHMVS